MKAALLTLCGLLFVGCATIPAPPPTTKPGLALHSEYVSPDAKLSLRLRVEPERCHYELSDRTSGQLLASAASAIVAGDFIEGRFRGTDDVVFAADGSGVIITEDLSDAGPILRYILFHRQPDGRFAVSYPKPPALPPRPSRGQIYYDDPVATGLSDARITFYYPGAHKTKVLPLSGIATTPTLAPQ